MADFIYSLPSWANLLLFVSIFSFFSLLGYALLNKRVKVIFGEKGKNETVGIFLGLFCAFYGIFLGLVFAGAWDNFSDAENAVTTEAVTIGTLRKDFETYPGKGGDNIEKLLKEYLNSVINDSWPKMQRKVVPLQDGLVLTKIQIELNSMNPENVTEQIMFQKAVDSFSELEKVRRKRIELIHTYIPSTVWMVLMAGTFLTLVLCWMFVFESHVHGVILHLFVGVLFGLIIFMIASLDQPLKGSLSVGTGAYIEALSRFN